LDRREVTDDPREPLDPHERGSEFNTGEIPVVPPAAAPPGALVGADDGAIAVSGPDGLPDAPQDGVVDERRGAGRRHKRRKRRRRLLVVVAIVLVLVVGIVGWYEAEAHPFGSPGQRVTVKVSRAESTGSIASALASHGVVGNSLAFQLSLFIHGKPTIEPGFYSFQQNISFSSAKSVLADGPNVDEIENPPGFTLSELAERVGTTQGHDAKTFLAEASSGAVTSPFEPPGTKNLEGLLGTGGYLITPGETDHEILTQMVDRFNAQAAKAGVTSASAAALGLTTYQLITVASIVEKEGYIVKNMPQVARVIYNRIANNMPLQMDSTVLYSLGQDGGTVTAADLKLNTPYNTYLHTGLTPTPICFPSVSAMQAAVSPPAGTWLYFTLVEKDGTEAFSTTFADQLANEKLAASRGLG
jgi:uncharacterized YceG family protein